MKKNTDKATIEVLFVPIDAVEPNPYNPNVMEEEKRLELKRLMAATDARAFFSKDPLRASPYDAFYGKTLDPKEKHEGRFVFIDGEHRWINAKELKWAEVGLMIDPITESQARLETYSKNYLRGSTDPVLEAKLFDMELKELRTVERVAKKYFKEASYVARSLALLQLSEKVIAYLHHETSPLKKTHLEHLIGLPEEDALRVAEDASKNHWPADDVKKRADAVRERIAHEKKAAELINHYVMKECPICGAPGMLDASLNHMMCSGEGYHYELGLRAPFRWNPLDTKEDMLKRKFNLDDGRSLPLEEIIREGAKKRAVPKRKPDWFKYEKTVEQLMPEVNAFAYKMLLASEPRIDRLNVSGKTKDGTDFHLDTGERGINARIGDKSLYIWFESKEWKRGNFKTRVNIQGVEDEVGLKQVQIFLDMLMRGEAKVEDYPFEAKKRVVQAPSSDESDEGPDEAIGEELEESDDEK